MSSGRYLCSTIRYSPSRRHLLSRSSSWRRRRPNSLCWHRRPHQWEFSCCPCRIAGRVRVGVRPPQYVAPPPNNIIYNNVHNTVVVNNVTNTVTVTNQSGQTTTIAPPAQAAAPAQAGTAGAPAAPTPVAAIAPALPPSVAQKAVTLQNQSPQSAGTPPSGPAQT